MKGLKGGKVRTGQLITQFDGMFNTRLLRNGKGVWVSDMDRKIYERHVFWQQGVFLAPT
jgi:hypothetical protein